MRRKNEKIHTLLWQAPTVHACMSFAMEALILTDFSWAGGGCWRRWRGFVCGCACVGLRTL
jgi:hypothetical protein